MNNETIEHIGNINLLSQPLLALLCSRSCPGEVILPTHDAVKQLRDRGVAVISGFHSPMEKECLQILLRGTQPVVLCAARSIRKMRVPPLLKKHISAGRLLIIAPFAARKRLTAEMSAERNAYIASVARELFVPYAMPGGSLESLCKQLLAKGKSILTIVVPACGHLMEMGCKPFGKEIVDSTA